MNLRPVRLELFHTDGQTYKESNSPFPQYCESVSKGKAMYVLIRHCSMSAAVKYRYNSTDPSGWRGSTAARFAVIAGSSPAEDMDV
jgi:hypothetical protein